MANKILPKSSSLRILQFPTPKERYQKDCEQGRHCFHARKLEPDVSVAAGAGLGRFRMKIIPLNIRIGICEE